MTDEPTPVDPSETPDEGGAAAVEAPRLRLAIAPGVTPTKWTRVWAQRRGDLPLDVIPVADGGAEELLREGTVDLALTRLPVDTEAFSVIRLYDETPVVVVGREHPLADLAEIDVTLLADEHLLQDPDDVPEWRDVATEVADGSRRPLPALAGWDDAVEQVAAGVGVVILPHALARMHDRKDVVNLPVRGVAETTVALVWPFGTMTPDIDDFIGVVRGRTANSTRGLEAPKPAEEPKKPVKQQRAKPRTPPGKPIPQRYRPRKPKRG